jgi:signal recognition particle receptor subunit beta
MSAVLEQRPAPRADASDSPGPRALRFLTAGSVDDGKSTLIGRLLYDSRAILADQLDALHARAAGEAIDLSLLTDGLESEREQGITIDVAFRYFATRRRKFIIADAPGHEQYTRNMVTAAAGSDAAVVLVDITKIDWHAPTVSLLAQTRRHALLAHLLRVPSIVFAVNKLDAVDRPQAAFEAVRHALQAFARDAGLSSLAGIVPVSALRGDNVTGSTVPRCWRCWSSCPPPRSPSTATCCCRCNTWRATTVRPPATSRAPCGGESRTAACAWATRCSCFPAARSRRCRICAAPATASITPWPGSRRAWCWTASSMCRAATGSRRPAP